MSARLRKKSLPVFPVVVAAEEIAAAAAMGTVPAVAETVAAEIKFFLKKMRRRSGFLAESVENQFFLKAAAAIF